VKKKKPLLSGTRLRILKAASKLTTTTTHPKNNHRAPLTLSLRNENGFQDEYHRAPYPNAPKHHFAINNV
jgi:hypothetical protein